jgi:hypothetical protein
VWLPVLVGLGALALYVATCRPDLVGGDPGEFQFVSWVLGIPHHTGYPLYTLAGWLWAQLPLGSVARRINLFSALFGAASVGLAAALAIKLARGVPGAAVAGVIAGLALAVAPLNWHWATIAGVRAGAVAEVGWMLLAAVGVLAAGDDRRGRALAWLGLSVGVALAHHRSGALAVPGIALALATVPAVWRIPVRGWLVAAGVGLLPLLTYLFLPIRARQGPPFHQWHPETWDGFWDLALALDHSRVHFAFPLDTMPARADLLFAHLVGELGRVGLVLALIGCVWLLVRWPRAWVVLAAFFGLQSWQVLNWDVGPDQLNVVYELPAHLVLAVWLGLGVLAIGAGIARMLPRSEQVRAAPVAAVGLLALTWLGVRGANGLLTVRANALHPVNHDRSVLADGYEARRIVGGGLARVDPNAVVVGDWEQATVVWYLQFVEGAKPDVQVNYPVTNLGAALNDYPGRPIWLMARTAVPPDRRLSADGPFVRVGRADEVAVVIPRDARTRAARFEDALELVGVAYADRLGRRVADPDAAGDVLPVTLYWRALGPSRKDLSVSVRLVDEVGRIAAQQDNASPVLSLYPTSRWREDEVVGDYYELPFRSLAPGRYRLEVRVYLVEGGTFRDLAVGGREYADVQTVVR